MLLLWFRVVNRLPTMLETSLCVYNISADSHLLWNKIMRY